MNFNSGPEFGSFGLENEPAIDKITRAEMLAELSLKTANNAQEFAVNQINRDPILHTMLSKVINCGPELDPDYVQHLRKMIALRLNGSVEIQVQAGQDRDFYLSMAWEARSELRELDGFKADLTGLPDMWDIAYKDLLHLEGGEPGAN